jgi:hypothetical protein
VQPIVFGPFSILHFPKDQGPEIFFSTMFAVTVLPEHWPAPRHTTKAESGEPLNGDGVTQRVNFAGSNE